MAGFSSSAAEDVGALVRHVGDRHAHVLPDLLLEREVPVLRVALVVRRLQHAARDRLHVLEGRELARVPPGERVGVAARNAVVRVHEAVRVGGADREHARLGAHRARVDGQGGVDVEDAVPAAQDRLGVAEQVVRRADARGEQAVVVREQRLGNALVARVHHPERRVRRHGGLLPLDEADQVVERVRRRRPGFPAQPGVHRQAVIDLPVVLDPEVVLPLGDVERAPGVLHEARRQAHHDVGRQVAGPRAVVRPGAHGERRVQDVQAVVLRVDAELQVVPPLAPDRRGVEVVVPRRLLEAAAREQVEQRRGHEPHAGEEIRRDALRRFHAVLLDRLHVRRRRLLDPPELGVAALQRQQEVGAEDVRVPDQEALVAEVVVGQEPRRRVERALEAVGVVEVADGEPVAGGELVIDPRRHLVVVGVALERRHQVQAAVRQRQHVGEDLLHRRIETVRGDDVAREGQPRRGDP